MRSEIDKRYKHKHPEMIRKLRRSAQKRHNDESLMFATRHRQLWGADEDHFLKLNAQLLTARDIAFTLGRSYHAIMHRASLQKVPLLTEEKKHGRLVTKR